MKEKRATDRFKPVKAITICLESDEGLPAFGVVANISDGGACVITDVGAVGLDVGADVKLTLSFSPNYQTVLTTGKLRWIQQDRCGVQFEPGPRMDDRLKSLIADNTVA